MNTRYLLGLDPVRLLHNFRVQAGIASSADPLGGWESPGCGLRGHFVGHYLTACSLGFAATGNPQLAERVQTLVAGLAQCQARIGSGYVAAFAESDLDTIETRFDGAWAPYYTLHKILAGLLAAYAHCANQKALVVAERLGDYIAGRIARLTSAQIEGMCRTDQGPNPSNEPGGIGEALQDLADATGRPAFDALARVFDRSWFVGPLQQREDRLTGLHANTHIAFVLALARRYERTGDVACRAAVEFFWDRIVLARTYANGGSSGPHPDGNEKSKGAEHWPEPLHLAHTLTPKINESCVTHNMLRITDSLFRCTADARYPDFFERALFNHVLSMQHPHEPGAYLYDHPLAERSKKHFGHAYDSFWCCYGSTVEAFERLGEGTFYHEADTLWVTQFVASALDWSEKAVTVELDADYPFPDPVRIVVRCDAPTSFSLRVRVPKWAREPRASLNEAGLEIDGEWMVILRRWQDGDLLQLEFPMSLNVKSMPDDASMVAFQYGPHVLAALTDRPLELASGVTPRRTPDGWQVCLRDGTDVRLVPLSEVVDEVFGVYFRVRS